MPTREESATCACLKCGHEPGMKDTTLVALAHLDFPRRPQYRKIETKFVSRTVLREGIPLPRKWLWFLDPMPSLPITTKVFDTIEVPEALLWTCAVCGYQWTTACADAEGDVSRHAPVMCVHCGVILLHDPARLVLLCDNCLYESVQRYLDGLTLLAEQKESRLKTGAAAEPA